jgi:Rps23 Pro-64 3,4-dihydroxylase Tpa1-like proline 4-hydroxylase
MWPNHTCIGESSAVPLLATDSANIDELAKRYSENVPFRHLIIDHFFAPDVAIRLGNAICAIPDREYAVSFRSLAQRKLQLGNISAKAPHIGYAYQALMGSTFVRFIEGVSSCHALEADRLFAGAGLQRYRSRGFSEIHLDANRHPFDAGLYHRVNLIVFMNPKWKSKWGGELVLWSSGNKRPDAPAVMVAPIFNRAVIFEVASKSWHSVNCVRCPDESRRNSMALFYFNRIAIGADEATRSNIWHSACGWPRELLFQMANRALRMAKPYARQLRWLRSNKFDGVPKS